jgi:hypothetical protein
VVIYPRVKCSGCSMQIAAGVDTELRKAVEERPNPNHFCDTGDSEYWRKISIFCQQSPKRRHLYEASPALSRAWWTRLRTAMCHPPHNKRGY